MANFLPKITWNTHAGADIFTFTVVPVGDPINEEFKADWDMLVANKGKPHIQYNHTLKIWAPRFELVPEASYTAIMVFWNTWGKLGKAFRYYMHSDLAGYIDVHLADPNLGWTIQIPDGAGGHYRKLSLKLRNYST